MNITGTNRGFLRRGLLGWLSYVLGCSGGGVGGAWITGAT